MTLSFELATIVLSPIFHQQKMFVTPNGLVMPSPDDVIISSYDMQNCPGIGVMTDEDLSPVVVRFNDKNEPVTYLLCRVSEDEECQSIATLNPRTISEATSEMFCCGLRSSSVASVPTNVMDRLPGIACRVREWREFGKAYFSLAELEDFAALAQETGSIIFLR